jgi:hypothetical protein
MKKLLLFAQIIFLNLQSFAQSPQKMSYQAVVRNSFNALVINSQVGMQISILQGSANGTAVYVETQNPTTNDNGLVSLEIGNGTVVTGVFASIDWATGPYFIKTETDPAGGSNYSIVGTSQLLSVPYAMYAETSGNTNTYLSGNGILISNDSIINSLPDLPVSITGSGRVNVAGTYPQFQIESNSYIGGQGIIINGDSIANSGDLSSINELQTISIVGDSLTLSNNGGSIAIDDLLAQNWNQLEPISIRYRGGYLEVLPTPMPGNYFFLPSNGNVPISWISNPLWSYNDDGEPNTQIIVDSLDASYGAFGPYGAKICNSLDTLGHNDWYVPSVNEMEAIGNQCYLIPGYIYRESYLTSSYHLNFNQFLQFQNHNIDTGGGVPGKLFCVRKKN